MILINLFKEFFKIGFLSVGGGYATLPFLYYISSKYHWYSLNELNQIIAISSITPGPIGINMATYAGMKTAGIIGALISTIALILPAYFLVVLVANFLKKYNNNIYVKSVLHSLRPAGCALLVSVAIKLIQSTIKDIIGIFIFIILFTILIKYKKSPLFFIISSALIGLFLNIIL